MICQFKYFFVYPDIIKKVREQIKQIKKQIQVLKT